MHSKITVFTVLSLLFSFTAFGQHLITGKIVDDKDHQPLVEAVVMLEPGSKVVLTDEKGSFEARTDYIVDRILVRYLGYEDTAFDVPANATNIGTISVQRSSTTLNEILVSASSINYKSDFKGSNFRLNPARMEKINPMGTEEVLRMVPGVNIVGDMGLSNRPNISIRGSWGRRSRKILLMEDGSPIAPAPYIAPGTYYNPVSDRVTSIEVNKGADMLRFGPNNAYGAVNYITALPPQLPELRVKLAGGPHQYRTGLVSYGGTWNNLGALVEGVYKGFDGFKDNSAVSVLNLNAKVFAKLSEDQSLYFKLSGQFEDNQATLGSQTPFTFDNAPTEHPFDADQFTMRRYGVDIIHKWLPSPRLSFTSKAFASDFERDWWRQVFTYVKASDVRDYVGEEIYRDRYSYLDELHPGDEDYVRVGTITNGKESTTDSRWTFTVSGIRETMNLDWDGFGEEHNLEVNFTIHSEIFKDQLLRAENSRWARHGNTTTDLRYKLTSYNGYIRNEFNFNQLSITPILRAESVSMYRQNLITVAQNPDLQDITSGRETNNYTQVLPGITLDYTFGKGNLYGSIYEGMIAPSKIFGFLTVKDGVATNPFIGESINIKPELSWNREIGWRGSMLGNWIDGQVAYFNNTSRNFYAAGEKEIFQTLGKVNVQGVELAFGADLWSQNDQQLRMFANVNFMKSKALEGKLQDNELFTRVIHSTATKQEFIDKVAANRNAYEIYVSDGAGGEILLTDEIVNLSDFDQITRATVQFGKGGLEDTEAPYTPRWNLSGGLDYDIHQLTIGASAHYVSEQFSEFSNFIHESANGTIGKIPSYLTFDAYLNYDFTFGQNVKARAFVNGKNLTNDIYRASRLNRGDSGIFGAGFRMFIAGVNIQL